MTAGSLKIEGRKFRIIPEEEYQALRAAMRSHQKQAAQYAADVAEAQRRLRDPKRKSIPLAKLKAELRME